MINLGHFMYSGILDRFPRLKLLILEANSGWVPFWLNRLEKYCEGRQSVFFDEHPSIWPRRNTSRASAQWPPMPTNPPSSTSLTTSATITLSSTPITPHPDAPATSEPLLNMMEQPLSDESKRKILWDNSRQNLRGKTDLRTSIGQGVELHYSQACRNKVEKKI